MREETSGKTPDNGELEREREREAIFCWLKKKKPCGLQFSQAINLNKTKIRSLCVLRWRLNDETKLGFEEIEVLTNRLPLKLLLRVKSVFKDVELVFSTVGIGGDLPEDSAIN